MVLKMITKILRTINDVIPWMNIVKASLEKGKPVKVTVSEYDKRSLDQNSLIHRWYDDISKHLGDVTPQEVKAECNLVYGFPILLQEDPQFIEFYHMCLEDKTYEQKIKALLREVIPVTSRMGKKQLSRYIDNMQRVYLTEGVKLTTSEDMMYEQELNR